MSDLSITFVRSYWWGRIACHRNDDHTWTATAELGPQWPNLTHTYTALHEDKNTAINAAMDVLEAKGYLQDGQLFIWPEDVVEEWAGIEGEGK